MSTPNKVPFGIILFAAAAAIIVVGAPLLYGLLFWQMLTH